MQLGLDCQECDDVLKRERGCGERGILPFRLDDDVFFRCPVKLVTSVTWEYLRAYNFYKKSILPNGNSWLGESQKFLDAMIVIEKEINRLQAEELKGKKHG